MRGKTYTFAGKTMTLREWSRETGISVGTLRERLYRRWPLQRILTEPNMTKAERIEYMRKQEEPR